MDACLQDSLMKTDESVEKNELDISENDEFEFNQDNSIEWRKSIEVLVGIVIKK